MAVADALKQKKGRPSRDGPCIRRIKYHWRMSGIRADIARPFFLIPLRDHGLIRRRRFFRQFDKPRPLFLVHVVRNRAADVLELVVEILAHRIELLQHGHLHLHHHLLVVAHRRMALLARLAKAGINYGLLGNRVARQDDAKLLSFARREALSLAALVAANASSSNR